MIATAHQMTTFFLVLLFYSRMQRFKGKFLTFFNHHALVMEFITVWVH